VYFENIKFMSNKHEVLHDLERIDIITTTLLPMN